MKLRLSQLKPNPFKKEINGGRLNEEQIARIQANIEELGLMGSLPVFKKGDQYYLIAGHHRAEAMRRSKGKDFEVEVTLHQYSEENVLRGMVVENLTQRMGEFIEEKENLLLIRKWLQSAGCSLSEQPKKGKRTDLPSNGEGNVRDIAEWLNKNGEVMSTGKICNILHIADNLSPALQEKVGKARTTGLDNQEEEIIPVKTAELLSKLDSHEEQEVMADILLDTDKFSNNLEREKAVAVYNSLSEEDKEKVLKGETDLSTVRKPSEAMSGGEMAVRFNKKANELVLEMRTLRKTLTQFRNEHLFEHFTPSQRRSFHARLETVREEYTNLMKELDVSIEVLQDE